MSFLDKAKKAVVDHADQIDGAVDKAADLANKQTKGKHTSKIDKASGKAHDLLRKLNTDPGKGNPPPPRP
jgi:ABC-type transporter Mla subunit MlaD